MDEAFDNNSDDGDSISPPSAADPDVDDAVVGLLQEICVRLSFDHIEPIDAPAPSIEALATTEAVDEEDWAYDRPTPTVRRAIPPPPPESDSGRVTDPEILSTALVYADPAELGVELDKEEPPVLDPRISVTSLLDEIELSMFDGAPASLRPMSRTSYPEPERRSTTRVWLAAAALALVGAGSVWWLSEPASESSSESAVSLTSAVHPQGALTRSTTPGTRLYVDGNDRGVLPLALHDLTAGKHELRFEAPKHRPLLRTLMVSAGTMVDLGEVTLAPSTERIRIELTPGNAYLQLSNLETGDNQRFAGPWPRVLDLPSGAYDVMAFRGGYRTWTMR